jgi:hypothetical protein
MSEEKLCTPDHTWGGIVPVVKPDLNEIQNADLIGKPCDCNKFLYGEEKCGCRIPEWKMVLSFNPNY